MFILMIINAIYWILLILFLGRMVVSFARVDPYHPTWGPIARFIYQTTEPMLEPVRRLIPPQGGLDLSPVIILFGIIILRQLLIGVLF